MLIRSRQDNNTSPGSWLKPAMAIGLSLLTTGLCSTAIADVLGAKKVIALRVYFQG